MAPAALMCLLWRGSLLYFVLRVLISSLSLLRISEIHTLRGLSSLFAFHGATNHGPIQRLIYMYTHVPPTSCYWLAIFFVQLILARPCLIYPCYLQMLRHYFMDPAPFSMVTLSFETSKTINLVAHYGIPEGQKHRGFYRMVMSHSSQTSWRNRRKWYT
jgi:hypothetical protein